MKEIKIVTAGSATIKYYILDVNRIICYLRTESSWTNFFPTPLLGLFDSKMTNEKKGPTYSHKSLITNQQCNLLHFYSKH